ncbi:hypothetical protein IWW52_000372 [Coemansia sp. RSA 2704]|nr:hypothetical protein IWW52_000372 [Coemansia sp. RSA 2704]
MRPRFWALHMFLRRRSYVPRLRLHSKQLRIHKLNTYTLGITAIPSAAKMHAQRIDTDIAPVCAKDVSTALNIYLNSIPRNKLGSEIWSTDWVVKHQTRMSDMEQMVALDDYRRQKRRELSARVTQLADRAFDPQRGRCDWASVVKKLDMPLMECLGRFDASLSSVPVRSLPKFVDWLPNDFLLLKEFVQQFPGTLTTDDQQLVSAFMNVKQADCAMAYNMCIRPRMTTELFKLITSYREKGMLWKDIHQQIPVFASLHTLRCAYSQFKAKVSSGPKLATSRVRWTDAETARQRKPKLAAEHADAVSHAVKKQYTQHQSVDWARVSESVGLSERECLEANQFGDGKARWIYDPDTFSWDMANRMTTFIEVNYPRPLPVNYTAVSNYMWIERDDCIKMAGLLRGEMTWTEDAVAKVVELRNQGTKYKDIARQLSPNLTARKRLRAGLSCLGQLLDTVDTRWLEVGISLNAYALVWRTYKDFNADAESSLFSSSNEWLILGTTLLSYIGLLLLLLFPALLLLKRVLRSNPPTETPLYTTSLLVVGVHTALSNYTGLVDIVVAPLFSDLMLRLWHWSAMISAGIAALAFPLYIATPLPQRVQTRWSVLFLPSIVASASASDITLLLEPRKASSLLSLGYVFWGMVIIPAISFAVVDIRRQLTGSVQLFMPLAVVSQLAMSVMALGIQSRRVWADSVGPANAPLLLGEMAMAAGAILGLILWAAAAAWFVNAHVVAIWLRPRADWLSTVYPVASFTLATIYLARIWASSTALLSARVLIAYVTTALLAIPTARLTRRLTRSARSSDDQPPATYGTMESV